jgi:hypothetical protein
MKMMKYTILIIKLYVNIVLKAKNVINFIITNRKDRQKMTNYTITENKTGYNEIHYKKFNSLKDCKKWIKNNLDNTKNYKVFNGLYYITLYNNYNYVMNDYRDCFNEDYINKSYINQLMEDYKNEIL